MDAGNDDAENLRRLRKNQVDWIIKRNLRHESPEDWLEEAQALGAWQEPRAGRQIYTGDTWRERDGRLQRVVFQVVQRTIAADGPRLLVPEIEIDTWWTSLGRWKDNPWRFVWQRLYHRFTQPVPAGTGCSP